MTNLFIYFFYLFDCLFIYLFIYFKQYLVRGAQFSKAGFNVIINSLDQRKINYIHLKDPITLFVHQKILQILTMRVIAIKSRSRVLRLQPLNEHVNRELP